MKTYLIRILTIAVLLFNGFLFAQTNPNHVWVNGYTKSNGTYVQGHYRTAPNSTNRDNFSTVGNTNPYTGKPGWVPADNNPVPTYNNTNTYNGTSTYTYTITTPKVNSYDYSNYYNTNQNSNRSKPNHYSGVPPTTGVTYYTTSDLRLRGGASTASEIILTMPQGAAIKVVNDFDTWAYVYYNGYYGYASSNYLSATPYVSATKQKLVSSNLTVPQIPNYTNYNNQNFNSAIPSGTSTNHSSGSGSGGGILITVIVIGLFFWWLKS